MADSTIPNLSAFTGTPNGTEVIETVQSGASVKIPSQKIADLATIVTPINLAGMTSLISGSQVGVYKLYVITNSTQGRILVKGLSTTTLEAGALNLTTGASGTYVFGTDTFTPSAGGNTNTVYLNKAALIALEAGGTLALTTRYRVTDATPYIMEVVPETISQLSHTATIVDDVYSGMGHWNPTDDIFYGNIQDDEYNVFQGVLPTDITLGAGSQYNTFFQQSITNVLGTNCDYNVFMNRANDITLGNNCNGNTFKQGANQFIFGNDLLNLTVDAGVTGADYTAAGYAFMYSNQVPCSIIFDGTNNYHLEPDPANDRIICTNLATLVVSYIGGGGVTGLDLEVNGTPNGDQTLLNLVAGTNITLTDDGIGSVTIDASGGGGGNVYLANDQTFTGENTFTISSGSDTPITINKGGSGAALTVNKTSGSGDAIEVANGSVSIADETASTIAHFDGSKRLKSLATSTYPSLTELSYVKGVTSAIQTQLNAKTDVYAVQCGAAIQATVADSTNYHMGIAVAATLNTTSSIRRFKFTNAGSVKEVSWNLFQSVNGSNETVTLYLRNESTSTDNLIGTFTSDFGANSVLSTLFTGLSITVNTTNDYVFKIATPAFGTNPTNWLPAAIISVQKT